MATRFSGSATAKRMRAVSNAPSATGGAPVTVLDVPDRIARDIYGYDLILLRPDMHVVWRGNAAPEDAAKVAAVATGFPVQA